VALTEQICMVWLPSFTASSVANRQKLNAGLPSLLRIRGNTGCCCIITAMWVTDLSCKN